MKILSLFVLFVAFLGCQERPEIKVTGKYLGSNHPIFESLDLAKGGAAMHKVSVDAADMPSVVSSIKAVVELGGAQWSLENQAIKVVGSTEHSQKNGTNVVYVFEIQPNGDLIRHNGEGAFVRFVKQ